MSGEEVSSTLEKLVIDPTRNVILPSFQNEISSAMNCDHVWPVLYLCMFISGLIIV